MRTHGKITAHRPRSARSWPGSAAAAVLAAACVLFLVGPRASAQEKFPSRPIDLIIPTPPGGGVDITGRMLAEAIEPILGVKLVVANVPGASGVVGVTKMTAAKADGYTLAYVWNAPLTVAPHVLQASYTTDSYTPISLITGGTPLIYCVRPDFPAKTGAELVELIKKNPGKFTYGNDGVGAMVQLAGERLFQPLGMKMRAVPFGGAGETLRNFLGAQVDIYGGSIPPIEPHLKDGKARCLLASTVERNPLVPEAMSAKDLGLADKATQLWRGVIAPKGVPADRIAILEAAFRKAIMASVFKGYEEKSGDKLIGSSAADFASLIAAEHADFGRVVQGLGIGKK